MPQYELNLRDYLRVFRKRKLVIIMTFLVVIGSSAAYLSVQSPIYQAYTTIKILERQSVAGILTEWIIYSPADTMQSQAKMIKGFPIMKKVALRLGLIDDNSSISEVHRMTKRLQSRINTETVEQTNIIKITASAGSPEEAVNIAEAVAHVYVEENLLEKKRQVSTARLFIEEQSSQLETRLKEGEERLREFGAEVRNVRLAEPIQRKLVDLEFEFVALLQKYTDKHPRVMRLKEQIKDLERQLEGFSGQELEYARLAREIEVNKKLYSMLKEKLEEARISEAQKIGDVSIVDPATMPTSPVYPKKKIGILMSGLVGLIIGVAFAFIVETLDTSIGTIEDVENLLKLPVLGVVPSVSREFKIEKGIFAQFKRRITPIGKSEAEEAYIRLIVHHQPRSFIAEAYRSIRTNLKLGPTHKAILITSAEPREGKTTILINLGVALAQKGAKTLLVSSDLRRPALAKTFGIQREPGLNEVIAGTIKLEEGMRNISDIMLGNIQFKDIVKTPGMENIWILPSGHLPPNPAEIFESKKLPDLIEEFKKRFDAILFDSPPVLPITDASLLAAKLDSVVLCYEIGRTARNALLRSKVQLESVGAKIAGVVLNHIMPQAMALESYPYYYRYKYKYRYYEDKSKAEGKKEKGEGEEPPK